MCFMTEEGLIISNCTNILRDYFKSFGVLTDDEALIKAGQFLLKEEIHPLPVKEQAEIVERYVRGENLEHILNSKTKPLENQLIEITDIEAYIKENEHLPEYTVKMLRRAKVNVFILIENGKAYYITDMVPTKIIQSSTVESDTDTRNIDIEFSCNNFNSGILSATIKDMEEKLR